MTANQPAELLHPATHVCRDCDAPIYRETGIGWVDARSGDDGGTFDYCAGRDGVDLPHRAGAAERIAR